jgi:glycosyltransferase involved in cell wall biosynthesis
MSDQAKPTLTVVALAWREADHLKACFESVQSLVSATSADTIVILNSDADAKTAEVARSVAQRVVVSRFVNFSVQRNRGLDAARTDWVFFIDPDERCAAVLANEIAKTLGSPDCAAYRVPRRNFLFGREVRHTGWWPDYQIRLLERACCRYDESREVHEFPIVDGPVGTLDAPLLHFNYENWHQFFAKQRDYSALDAHALFKAGRRARVRGVVGQPLREFKRRFIDYQGYMDGLLGLELSLAMAWYAGITYKRLWSLQRRDFHKDSTN